jgi:hypothetical protein
MRLLLITLFLAAAAWPARSDTLPGATTAVRCTADKTQDDSASICSNGGASASLSLAPSASVRAQASAPGADATGLHASSAAASIDYSFEVLGGQAGDIVPLIFTVNLTVSASSLQHLIRNNVPPGSPGELLAS